MKKNIKLLFLLIMYLISTIKAQTPITFNTKTDFSTGTQPRSLTIGDLNGDGKPDLVVGNNGANTVSVLLNTTSTGDATPFFSAKTDYTTGSSPISVSIGDLNGDGKPDLAIANWFSHTVSVLINTTATGSSTPSFSSKTDFTTGLNPTYVFLEDLNSDGKLDLTLTNFSSNSVSVLINTTTAGASTPSFSTKVDFIVGSEPVGVSIGDINGDSKPDIAVANADGAASTVSVLINTTTSGASIPSFSSKTDFAIGLHIISISVGDLNDDGFPEIVTVNSKSNSVSVLINTTTSGASTPSFSSKTDFTTGFFPTSVFISDLNGDGKPDLAVTNKGTNSVSVFSNTTTTGASTPSFSTKIDFITGNSPRGVSVIDLNDDGKPDLAVANSGSNSVSILLNTIVTGIEEVKNFILSDFTLNQNYPNPFNPSTNISFSILNESFVSLKIYDILGNEVVQLINRQLKNGSYNFSFDAKGLTSGVYFYRLTAISRTGNFIETKKMILLK